MFERKEERKEGRLPLIYLWMRKQERDVCQSYVCLPHSLSDGNHGRKFLWLSCILRCRWNNREWRQGNQDEACADKKNSWIQSEQEARRGLKNKKKDRQRNQEEGNWRKKRLQSVTSSSFSTERIRTSLFFATASSRVSMTTILCLVSSTGFFHSFLAGSHQVLRTISVEENQQEKPKEAVVQPGLHFLGWEEGGESEWERLTRRDWREEKQEREVRDIIPGFSSNVRISLLLCDCCLCQRRTRSEFLNVVHFNIIIIITSSWKRSSGVE